MFKKNLGTKDRKFRLIFGTALFILAFMADILGIVPRVFAFGVVIISIAMVATGLFGFCGFYLLTGKNRACKIDKEENR